MARVAQAGLLAQVEQARVYFERGKTLYGAGDYTKAVQEYLAAYRIAGDEDPARFTLEPIRGGEYELLGLLAAPNAAANAAANPLTPDHVIRTKRVPMLGATAGNVASYSDAYRRYFADQAASLPGPLTMLDPAPRVALDTDLGLIALGRTASEAAIAAEIYRHTIDIILGAERLGGYRALPAADIFEVEYWDLEQAKLKRQPAPKMFAGEIALVTGAASGIGKACVASLLARGAAVVALDIDSAVDSLHQRKDFLGVAADVTD